MSSYQYALEHLKIAEKLEGKGISKEFDYLLGKIYHRLEKLDEAIAAFEEFKLSLEGSKEKDEEYQVSKMIGDCRFAKKAMAESAWC